MKHSAGTIAVLLLLAASLLEFTGCGSSIEMTSRWKADTGTPDTTLTTQNWALTQVPDVPVLVGFGNDDSSVYVYIIAQNRQMARQMVLSGMTLWFDPEGGTKEYFGVHYPMGMNGGRDMFMRQNQPTDEDGDREEQFVERRDQLMKESLANAELIGPGKYDRETCSILQLKGMTINVRDEGERFVYELKIPKQIDPHHPYAIGITKDHPIGIQIKTGAGGRRPNEMSGERPGGGEGGGGEYPGGGGGGRRGGGRGFGSARGGRQRPEAMKPLDVSIELHLAQSPQVSQGK